MSPCQQVAAKTKNNRIKGATCTERSEDEFESLSLCLIPDKSGVFFYGREIGVSPCQQVATKTKNNRFKGATCTERSEDEFESLSLCLTPDKSGVFFYGREIGVSPCQQVATKTKNNRIKGATCTERSEDEFESLSPTFKEPRSSGKLFCKMKKQPISFLR